MEIPQHWHLLMGSHRELNPRGREGWGGRTSRSSHKSSAAWQGLGGPHVLLRGPTGTFGGGLFPTFPTGLRDGRSAFSLLQAFRALTPQRSGALAGGAARSVFCSSPVQQIARLPRRGFVSPRQRGSLFTPWTSSRRWSECRWLRAVQDRLRS